MANEYQYPAPDAVVLPNLFATPGEALQQKAALNERRAERDAALKQQNDERNKLYNLGQINKETDQSQFKPITQRLDDYTVTQLKKIKQNALANYTSLDPAEMEYRLGNDMNGFLRWHTAAESTAQNIEKGLADFNKTYPGISSNDAHDYAMNNFANDFLTQDKDGNAIPKDPSLIKPRDYVGEMNNPKFIGAFNKDASGFINFLQDTKPTPISADDTKVRDASGRLVQLDITGGVTPFKEIVKDANGTPTGLRTKADYITIGKDNNGQPIKLPLLPDEQVGLILQNPKVKAGALQLWNEKKMPIEEAFVKNNHQPINSVTEDLLFRNFLYNFIDKSGIDQSHLTTKSADEQRMPHYTTNINLPKDVSIYDKFDEVLNVLKDAKSKGADSVPITAIDSDAKDYIINSVNNGRTDKKKLLPNNLIIVAGNDGTIRAVDTKSGGDVVGVFNPASFNIHFNKTQKEEQKIKHNYNNQQQDGGAQTNEFDQYKRHH